jgi:hypothetical protein
MDGKLQTRVAFSIDGLQPADGQQSPTAGTPTSRIDPAVLKHIGDTKDDAVGDLLKAAGDAGRPREGYRRQPQSDPVRIPWRQPAQHDRVFNDESDLLLGRSYNS